MGQIRPLANWKWWTAGGSLAACMIVGVLVYLPHGMSSSNAQPVEAHTLPSPHVTRVEVIQPRAGELSRTTTQPGSVQAFESVQLYAGASGYLKTQTVDIGDRVKRDQVLAVVDVPDLQAQVKRRQSEVAQAQAKVDQANAQVVSAKAAVVAATAAITQAETAVKSKAAELRFREQQLKRMKDLYALKSIDERLVDEKTEQRDAALEADNAAVAAVAAAKAQLAACKARVEQAQADVGEAESEVKVAQAELENAQVLVSFATVKAPFDGVITRRNFFPGDYVRAASEGGASTPLLTIQRTDKFRVVVQVPDRDVPYTHPGDNAIVEIDALPGEKFPAKVSRIADSEDPNTRLMHVEIDVKNPQGKIRNGMYGHVTIILEKSKFLAIPDSCLIDRPQGDRGEVYVVRDGHAQRVSVRIGTDNGVDLGIASGLTMHDKVIKDPANVNDGMPVAIAATS